MNYSNNNMNPFSSFVPLQNQRQYQMDQCSGQVFNQFSYTSTATFPLVQQENQHPPAHVNSFVPSFSVPPPAPVFRPQPEQLINFYKTGYEKTVQEIIIMKSCLSEAQTSKEALESQLKEAEKQINIRDVHIQRLNNQLSSEGEVLEKPKIIPTEMEKSKFEKMINKQSGFIIQLEDRIAKYKENIQRLQTEKDSLAGENATLQDQLNTVQEEKVTQSNHMNTVITNAVEVVQRLAALEEQLQMMKEKNTTQEDELKDALTALKEEKKQHSLLCKQSEETQKLKEQHDKLLDKALDEAERRRLEIKHLEKKIKELDEKAKVDQESMKRKDLELNEIQKNLDKFEKNSSNSLPSAPNSHMERQLIDLSQQLNVIMIEKKKLQCMNDQLERENSELRRKFGEISTKCNNVIFEATKLRQQNTQLSAKNELLDKKLKDTAIEEAKMEKLRVANERAYKIEIAHRKEQEKLRYQVQELVNEQTEALHHQRKTIEVNKLIRNLQISDANVNSMREEIEQIREEASRQKRRLTGEKDFIMKKYMDAKTYILQLKEQLQPQSTDNSNKSGNESAYASRKRLSTEDESSTRVPFKILAERRARTPMY